jgi:hypothetical protein
MMSLDFFNLPNPSLHWAFGFAQTLTEMSTENMFLGSRTLSVRRADNPTTICELTV